MDEIKYLTIKFVWYSLIVEYDLFFPIVIICQWPS
jgi:hypothetical protein